MLEELIRMLAFSLIVGSTIYLFIKLIVHFDKKFDNGRSKKTNWSD